MSDFWYSFISTITPWYRYVMSLVLMTDEMPRSHSMRTYLWGMCVKLLSGYHPTLYSCQKSLPYLPLPGLNDAVDKFLVSVRALYGKDSDEYLEFETEAKASGTYTPYCPQ